MQAFIWGLVFICVSLPFTTSVAVNQCTSNPCINDAVCSSLAVGYECVCSGVYIGRDCSKISCIKATNVADILLVLDESGSVTEVEYKEATNWIAQVLTAFKSNLKAGGIHLGLIGFSYNGDQTTVKIPLSPAVYDTLKAQINNLEKTTQHGPTYIGYAINMAVEHFSSNGRNGVPKTMILLTDGRATDSEAIGPAVKKAMAAGITIISVGIGTQYNSDQLLQIAQDPSRVIMANSFEDLNLTLPSVINTIGKTTDICPVNPCKNGATYVGTSTGYRCICTPGYNGDTCSNKIGCKDKPCKNGGTCIDTNTSYECTCPTNYFGFNCGKTDNCPVNPCKNGATYVSTLTGYRCICTPGYSGVNCTQEQVCPVLKADIMFVLDESLSVDNTEYKQSLTWINNVLAPFKSDIDSDNVRVGLVGFSNKGYFDTIVRIHLQKRSASDLAGSITGLINQRKRGSTYIGFGITVAGYELEVKQRKDIPNIMIVITDGVATDTTADIESAVKDAGKLGAKMIAVGIGQTNAQQLELIAGSKTRVHHVSNYKQLPTLISSVDKQIAESCK
ncbi:collagen alpha-5(VI) chain [Ciona intestinalis]